MKSVVFQRLMELHGRHGPSVFGKICQKLVALAFQQAGCIHVVERAVQGVDIDAAWQSGEKYSAEIKTTKKRHITFGKKDVDGLAERRQDGYQPLLGVLRLAPLANWYLVDARHLSAGTFQIDSLRPMRRRDLEAQLQPFFDTVVEKLIAN